MPTTSYSRQTGLSSRMRSARVRPYDSRARSPRHARSTTTPWSSDWRQPNPGFHVENFGILNFSSFLAMARTHLAKRGCRQFRLLSPGWHGSLHVPVGDVANVLSGTANDNWWGAKAGFRELPVPKRLVWIESGGQENRAQLLRAANRLDAGQHLALGIFEAIQARNPNVIAWHDGFPFSWTDPCPRQLEINTTVPPWDDPGMRQAVGHIVDRQQIIDIVYEGSTLPSRTMFVQYGAMQPFIDAVARAGLRAADDREPCRGPPSHRAARIPAQRRRKHTRKMASR